MRDDDKKFLVKQGQDQGMNISAKVLVSQKWQCYTRLLDCKVPLVFENEAESSDDTVILKKISCGRSEQKHATECSGFASSF